MVNTYRRRPALAPRFQKNKNKFSYPRRRFNFTFRKPRKFVKRTKFFFDSVHNATSSLLTNPFNLMVIACAFVLISTHILDSENSYFKKFVDNLKNSTATEPIGTWISTNSEKTYGIVISLIVVISAPPRWRAQVFLTSFIVIIVLKSQTWIIYALTSYLTFLYIKIRHKYHKLIVTLLLVLVLFYNHFLAKK